MTKKANIILGSSAFVIAIGAIFQKKDGQRNQGVNGNKTAISGICFYPNPSPQFIATQHSSTNKNTDDNSTELLTINVDERNNILNI